MLSQSVSANESLNKLAKPCGSFANADDFGNADKHNALLAAVPTTSSCISIMLTDDDKRTLVINTSYGIAKHCVQMLPKSTQALVDLVAGQQQRVVCPVARELQDHHLRDKLVKTMELFDTYGKVHKFKVLLQQYAALGSITKERLKAVGSLNVVQSLQTARAPLGTTEQFERQEAMV